MNIGSAMRGLAAAGLLCACAGCSNKSPEEIEAERAKAVAEWNAQAAGAERVREEEEKKLVAQQIAEHERQAQIDTAREQQAEIHDDKAEQERLMRLVRAKYADPDAVTVKDVHWNSTKSALCGEVSAPNGHGGPYPGFMRFIVNGDEPVIDSSTEEDHARFNTAAQSVDCSQ
jgi:hypothetical protein